MTSQCLRDWSAAVCGFYPKLPQGPPKFRGRAGVMNHTPLAGRGGLKHQTNPASVSRSPRAVDMDAVYVRLRWLWSRKTNMFPMAPRHTRITTTLVPFDVRAATVASRPGVRVSAGDDAAAAVPTMKTVPGGLAAR